MDIRMYVCKNSSKNILVHLTLTKMAATLSAMCRTSSHHFLFLNLKLATENTVDLDWNQK